MCVFSAGGGGGGGGGSVKMMTMMMMIVSPSATFKFAEVPLLALSHLLCVCCWFWFSY